MPMMKCSVMLYPYKHASKKEAQKYVGAIKNGILNNPQEMTVAQLANTMTSGYTVILGHAEYSSEDKIHLQEADNKIGASMRHWNKQQAFAIDFDNDGEVYFSIERALAQCAAGKVQPAFAYTTDSHKDDHHKFRLVFIMDEVIDNIERHRDVVNSLFNLFLVNDECIVDTKCSDPCRLFYPGKAIVHKNYSALVNTKHLIESYNGIASTVKRSKTGRIKRTAVNESVRFESPGMIGLIKARRIEEIRQIIVNKLCAAETRVFAGLEDSRLKGKQVSNIYYTLDTCFPFSQRPAKPVTIRHPDDYYAIIRKFPLDLLLGIPKYENVSCILPTHSDNKPSARIELTVDDDYVYHCYGCDSFLDLFNVLERLTGWSHLQAKSFMNELLHVRFETEWQMEKKQEITEYQDFIWSDQFSLKYPWLQKRLSHANALGTLNIVLQMARLYIYDRKVTSNEKPLFYMALSLMAKKAKDFGQKSMVKTTLHKKIKLLTKLGLIEIIKEDDLPVKFRRTLQARKAEREQHYRINCFAIPEFTMALLDKAEAELRNMEKDGMRRKYYCREAELRTNGSEAANGQYVQDENRVRSNKVEEFYTKYKKITTKLVVKGWTTEKEILAKMKEFSPSRKQEYSGICLPQLLRDLNLKRVSYSKQYETQFTIKKGLLSYGVSKIIVAC
jgi:hypothetical protein